MGLLHRGGNPKTAELALGWLYSEETALLSVRHPELGYALWQKARDEKVGMSRSGSSRYLADRTGAGAGAGATMFKWDVSGPNK